MTYWWVTVLAKQAAKNLIAPTASSANLSSHRADVTKQSRSS